MLELPYDPAALARKILENHFFSRDSTAVNLEYNDDIKAGCFVSLKKKADSSLRGCIGTTEPTRDSLAYEIAGNALAAALRDPRFPGLSPGELTDIYITVDILGEQQGVVDYDQLDPRKYGLVVVKGQRKGVLLPDLDGVETVEKQLEIAGKKAGLSPEEIAKGDFDLYRFPVHRFKEQKDE